MNVDEVYIAIAERMRHADSEVFLSILEKAMTPEEARLLLELPASNEDLAAMFNKNQAEIESTIHDFARRGLVVSSKKGYRLASYPGTMMDAMMGSAPEYILPEVRQLWKQYYETVGRYELKHGIKMLEKPTTRVIPAQKSIPGNIELLASESVKAILEGHIGPVCILNCSCRSMLHYCDRPVHTCVHFGRRAENDLYRGAGSEISVEDAISEALAADEAGLITNRQIFHFLA